MPPRPDTAVAIPPATAAIAGDRAPGSTPTATTAGTADSTTPAPDLHPPTSVADGAVPPRLPEVPADHLAGPVPVSSIPVEAPVVARSPVSGAGPDLEALATSFTRTLDQGDGDYSVSVSMHPPELGEVRALLSLRGDVLQVVLTPHQETGHDALASSLPALRDQLASGGLQVDVSLGQPGTTPGEDGGPSTRPAADADGEHEEPSPRSAADVAPTAIGADTRIHLVL